jgi:RHS repeat-associated protein
VWNEENELVTNYVPASWKSEFVYDGKLKRRIERDYSWNGGSWIQTNEIHFVYDGNVILQHRDGNNLPTLTLTRGLDLSGSLQGAGGIGGLLALTENPSTLNAQRSATSFYHSDGNGDVTCLINASNSVVARAEYDPFGGFLSLSGSKAGVNRYWFSSKPIHWQSGKYDFLYRWYTPQLDRWITRDPAGGTIGRNLYNYVENNPLAKVDKFGLYSVSIQVTTIIRPPDPEDGVKTKQAIVVDEDGTIEFYSDYTGSTDTSFHTFPGSGDFGSTVSADFPDLEVTLSGRANTAVFDLIPQLPLNELSIRYSFDIDINFCSHSGHLSGFNETYPSYVVEVNGKQVYDFQQQRLSGLLGFDPVYPNVEFTW